MMVNRMAGWWFQTFVYFPFHIWDNPPTIDELIFFKMVKTTNQYTNYGYYYIGGTVDGRNPAPVNRWLMSTIYIGFQPSQVVQDFFHPQYVKYYNTLWIQP